jgi:nucleotide-binding universal stress UspA family protein
MYKRILVPVDGSETANRGLAEALKLARSLGAALKLVHVVDNSALALNPEAGIAAAPLAQDFSEDGKGVLEEAKALATREGASVEAALHENFTGRVADLIVQEAKSWGADLIVMGTHGRRGIRHAVLGSDAEAVVRAATVPVLLVRAPGRI